ncbi:MAG: TetR/AcrR family transcriptional regulator [Kineosporiaceae bacterium]|nr:TetR/AcrR family transcriptional regulator [Aeromicrobium sp.]
MPRVVDHDERRAAIIRATWEQIAEKGIDETSMRNIARSAGYANAGTLSHFFNNKNDLMQRAYEYVYEATNRCIRADCTDAVGISGVANGIRNRADEPDNRARGIDRHVILAAGHS